MTAVFDDLNHACKGLLLTTASVLNENKLKYVIAGGGVPLLSDSNHPSLMHPGTRDVDVLLMDELPATQSAARALLAASFRPSAKHEFQLLRDAQVAMRESVREFVFNVDLMHPSEAERTPEMFSDIFDLGVNDAYDPRGSRFMKSIAFKSARIIYEEELFSTITVAGLNLDGKRQSVSVPILSPAAAILSKCESVTIPKRTRDAFDIYFILSGSNGTDQAIELKELSDTFPQVADQLDHLNAFLSTSSDQFNRNVEVHAGCPIPTAAAETKALLFT